MPFRFANVAGRSALVDAAGQWFDLARISGDSSSAEPMTALRNPALLVHWSDRLDECVSDGPLDTVRDGLGAPVPRPLNSIAIGLNYADHAAESNMEVPTNPLAFAKFSSCIVGPFADVELRSEHADYEVELVVVIGTGGRDIAEADAWSHVLGLTIGQDISDRALQFAAQPPHFDLGKSRDTYGPMGPVLMSIDAFADVDDISLRCTVNGETRQASSTKHLIFGVPKLVSYLSSVMTLTTGDVIFTGTPNGIGATQGRFLQPGDVIVSEIDGIGSMTNRCVA
jgi:2,4-didehydro-3-deoxy-L-rhamnonate hydrolase